MKNEANTSPGNCPEDPLDAFLAKARWPEPTRESASELLGVWAACSPASRRVGRSSLLPACLGLAAAIIVVTGTAIAFLHQGNPTSIGKVPSGTPHAIAAPVRSASTVLHVVSRPPTPYERWMLLYVSSPPLSRSIESGPREHLPPLAETNPPDAAPEVASRSQNLFLRLSRIDDTATRRRIIVGWLSDGSPVGLDAAIAALADARLRPDAWAAAASAPPPPPDLLMAHFNDLHADYRLAAARLLGRSCDPEHRQLLERMVRLNDHRREALAALLCCHDERAAKFLEQLQPNRSFNALIRSARAQVARLCS
jgi:hypothetical protein